MFGSEESGFSVASEGGTIVRVHAWGFWDPQLAATFPTAVADACRGRRPVDLLLDVSRLKPQRDEGQEAFRQLMLAIKTTVRRVGVVVTNTITRMQLARISREAAAGNWSYFASESVAATTLAGKSTMTTKETR